MNVSVFHSLRRSALGLLCAGLMGLAFVPTANATIQDQRTVVTFNTPVEIPGQVLGPGTYVFMIHNPYDPISQKNTIQIFNQDETHLIATIMTIPTYHENPVGHSVFRFYERPRNNPPALAEWLYPGNSYGHQFVYRNPAINNAD